MPADITLSILPSVTLSWCWCSSSLIVGCICYFLTLVVSYADSYELVYFQGSVEDESVQIFQQTVDVVSLT